MNHLDDGTLQAFLDDELTPRQRAEVAEHILACGECRAARDELAEANALFSEAVAELDVAVPTRSVPPTRERRRGLAGGSFVKAAGLILALAAAASAAVPGSPVRQWIEHVVEPAPVAEVEPATVEPPAPPPAEEAAPAGVSLLPRGTVEIAVLGLEGASLRLEETDGESVSVSARGAQQDPLFRTSAGRIEVRGGVGGEVTILLPRSLRSARVVVDGELYAEKVAGELTLHVPGSEDGTAIVWP